MASSPTHRGTIDKLFADKHPYLSSVQWMAFRERPDEYSIWGNVGTSDEMKEVDFMVAELGLVPQKLENAPIAVDSVLPSFQKEFLHLTFALGTEVSLEALQDDRFSIMRDMAKALGYSMRQTVELEAANEWFNLAFSTATAADNIAIYGTHTTAGGTTIDNALTVDLDIAGLRTVNTYFHNLRSERGHRIRGSMRTVIVPPDLEFAAIELLESQLKPGTADNNTNPLRRKGATYEVCHYLTSSTNFFAWDDKSQHKAKFYWRIRPQTIRDSRYSTQSALTGMYARFSVGVSDYRCLVGSQPT